MASWAAVFVMLGVTVRAIRLNMESNSIDDMYDGCSPEMWEKVETEFLQKEKEMKSFSLSWDEAEKYYNDNWIHHNGNLKKEHIMAIYAYTLNKPNIHQDFNKAVREGKKIYKTKFMYHTLHFFLTGAIQALNCQRSGCQTCVTTYRGVNKAIKNVRFLKKKTFRFGSFASSSLNRSISLEFGKKTCFVIDTCFGANITEYSSFERESEVLIPPYEVFEVIKSEKRTKKNKLPCEVVYTVKSTNTPKSNLNCALFRNKQSPMYN